MEEDEKKLMDELVEVKHRLCKIRMLETDLSNKEHILWVKLQKIWQEKLSTKDLL